MNNTTTSPFSIQAKPLFRYERNAGRPQQGKKMDTTATITGTGIIGGLEMKARDNRGALRYV
jgi:hypothetical protein